MNPKLTAKEHWDCECGIVNHNDRVFCLGCDEPRPDNVIKPKAKLVGRYSGDELI